MRPPREIGQEIGIGLMGLGVVGGGVAQALLDPGRAIQRKSGCPVTLKRVLVRDKSKHRSPDVAPELLTTDPQDLLSNPEVHVVVEAMGGESPAYEYIEEGLSRGKHVVTANKEVMAKHGPELIALAASKKSNLLFEAAVGGGVPIIGPLMSDFLANDITSIRAIINGTTNYILTRMSKDNKDFGEALKEAQQQGYAEADPSNDVDGLDAAFKLAVLATLAMRVRVHPEDVYREGISRLRAQDFHYARELGYTIKLLAIARREQDTVQVRVHPCLIPQDHMLAKVEGAFNAIEVEGDLVGRVLFHGLGAGRAPTTSAIIGDVVEIARNLHLGSQPVPMIELDGFLRVAPISSLETKYYLRLAVADRPGVLAQIAKILGDQDISIASVIQKDRNPSARTAEIVVTTHPAREDAMQESLQRIDLLEEVREISNLLRMEELPID